MKSNLLTRRRMLADQEVREPTLLVFALAVTGLIMALGICFLAIAGLPAFGYSWWIFAAAAATLAWLVWGLRRRPKSSSRNGRGRSWHRILALARLLFIVVLTCWLGLIVWAAFGPGGPNPPPKANAVQIRVVTWNLHCGQDHGPPWKQFNWPVRKHALRVALDHVQPDIFCVQEATPDQVLFIDKVFPGYQRVGLGRDGGARGEHCAIYFNQQRFEEIEGNTFWLEEPIDQPRAGSALDVKRLCTWVRLRDRVSGRTLRVYNTHLYLTEAPRLRAAKLILAHIAARDPDDAVLLTADFNASPGVPSRRLFAEAGLSDSAVITGQPAGKPTFHGFYGIGLSCIDGILVDKSWRVHNHLILDVKPERTFPSDHFGLLVDLDLYAS